MKRAFITMMAIVAVNAGISAQGSFGVKGGLNVASQGLSGLSEAGKRDPDETKPIMGFNAGMYLTLMFTDRIGVQPELLYASQGSKPTWYNDSYEDELGYITLPVLFRFNINELFSLHTGPQVGYLLSATEKYEGKTTDIKGDLKNTDFGVAFGAELDLPARLGYGTNSGGASSLHKVNLPSRLGFGARYVLGLYDIAKSEGSWAGYEVRNNAIQLYLKYRISGG